MGNNQSFQDISTGKYSSVNQLPQGHPPPSAPSVSALAMELAAKHFSYNNPTNVDSLRKGARTMRLTPQTAALSEGLREKLSTYTPETQPYTDKVYQLHAPSSQKLNVWISSTKNSDHTVSYWVMYPVHDMHIRAAFLKIMNIDINAENLSDISERYPTLYNQVALMLDKKTVKCEQIDPLYMNNVIKSLVMQGYKPQELNLM